MFNWFRFTVCLSLDLCFDPTVHYFNETWGNYRITGMFSIGGTKGRELFLISFKPHRIFVLHRILSPCSWHISFLVTKDCIWNLRSCRRENKTEQAGYFRNFSRHELSPSCTQALCCRLEIILTMILHRPCLPIAQFVVHSCAFEHISESHLPLLISSQDSIVRNISTYKQIQKSCIFLDKF